MTDKCKKEDQQSKKREVVVTLGSVLLFSLALYSALGVDFGHVVAVVVIFAFVANLVAALVESLTW